MDEERRRILPKTGYPRRRAVAACLTCRERKRKCDNLRPSCSSCQQIGTSCEYIKQDASTFDAASLKIIDQLSVIEELVRDIHTASPLNLSSILAGLSRPIRPAVGTSSEFEQSSDTERVTAALNLDAGYRVATDKILQWPIFDKLLSSLQRFKYIDFHGCEAYTYLDDILSQSRTSASHALLESSKAASPSINISTERSDIEQLVDQYFQRVNIKNPVLSRRLASQYCQQYYEHGALFNLETCLVLLICALGAISMDFDFPDSPNHGHDSHENARLTDLILAHCYFVAAEKRLGAAMSTVNVLSIQCLCLTGIYHMFSFKPLHALRMFQAAGSSIQIGISTGFDSVEKAQIYSGLFWTCYKSEREILAEIPISSPALREPATQDSYPPPPQATSTDADEWATHEEDSWYFFLSEIALRRLTDQVADVVSKFIDAKISSHKPVSIEEFIPVAAELERQAEALRAQLPPAMRFFDVPQIASTDWQQYSRGRHYRVLELMNRPFVFVAIHEPDCSSTVRSLAEKGLINALKYIQHSRLGQRHHGTWLQLRNMFKSACLLLAASRSTQLMMPDEWESGVAKSLQTFNYWTGEFPCCHTYTNAILTLADSPQMRQDGNTPVNCA